MSIVRYQPGVPAGSPDRIVVQVSAVGSTDAADRAKREARSLGYVVKTMGRVTLCRGESLVDWKTERRDWNVELVVRKAA